MNPRKIRIHRLFLLSSELWTCCLPLSAVAEPSLSGAGIDSIDEIMDLLGFTLVRLSLAVDGLELVAVCEVKPESDTP